MVLGARGSRMNRFAAAAFAVAAYLLSAFGFHATAAPDARALPMQFELWTEGPAQACGNDCRSWISATGAITTDTPRDFEAFAKTQKLDGLAVALDSDGGSVLGALALGRAIRRLGMATTVGKTVVLSSSEHGKRRARLSPQANCESMCAFVLLAGVERHVPAEARVMVHQIWLGDRRDDPTAANYSAEDLVVVQRDIGRLAQYTVEMGGGIDLLEIALKIPPWEPMRLLSRDELRGMKIVTGDNAPELNSGASANSVAMANGVRASVNGRSWTMHASADAPRIGRVHPLTVEGEELGSFEVSLSCEESGRDYTVIYIEQRRGGDAGRMPAVPTAIEITLSGKSVALKVLSSRPNGRPLEIESVAHGRLPADSLKAFAEPGGRSLTVETASQDITTAIRVGNAGFARALPQLLAGCANRPRVRNTARNEVRQGG
jgi:hypothetical protein